MKNPFSLIIFMWILLTATMIPQTGNTEIDRLIAEGSFAKASRMIDELIISGDLSQLQIWELAFQKERLRRIRLDFKRTADDVRKVVEPYYPDVNDAMLDGWIRDNTLEAMTIDGELKFFNRAAPNLFRVNKEAKARKLAKDGKNPADDELPKIRDAAKAISLHEQHGGRLHMPVDIKLDYTVTVDADAVPDGEIIRCWLPYPKDDVPRQKNIRLLSVNAPDYVVAPNHYLQRTIYFEKKAEKGKPTVFNTVLEYTGYADYAGVDFYAPATVTKDPDLVRFYTKEDPPHIIFSDKIKDLSRSIVGDEKNPATILKLIYDWMNANIPWAGAREYSTIPNISEYCVDKKYGDCGIQSLLLITLCRYNGIPAKWQSGWMVLPDEVNLHDWCEVYLDQYGWFPVDPSFKLLPADNEKVRYFYVNGIDPYHFVVNNDISKPLYPAKIYPRSETVDFQRGELEWRGGNLYFDVWDYDMKVSYTPVEQ